jgi:hypothetical protein
MGKYVCHNCDMSVAAMNCGSCGKELVHDTLTKDDGSTVDVSKCPGGCGKIKSR